MKKIFIFILLIFITLNVKAANVEYNVTNFNLNNNYTSGSIKGWAIIKGFDSGNLKEGKECKASYDCDVCDDKDTYDYQLTIISVKKSGTSYKEVASKTYNVQGGTSMDQTFYYCPKKDGLCDLSKTTCYNNVGFNLTFNAAELMGDGITGFKFRLTVISKSQSETVDLVFDNTVANDNAKKFIITSKNITLLKQLDTDISCSNKLIPTKENNNLQCSSSEELELNTGENCINSTNNQYYSIACVEKINITSTHSDLDGLKGNSSITHQIVINSTKECGGTFDKELWLNDYNLLKTAHDSVTDTKLKQYYATKIEKLKSYVTQYITRADQLKVTSINPKAVFNISYKLKKGTKNDNLNMVVQTEEGEGVFTEKNEIKLGISGLTNPYQFNYTNKDNPSTAKIKLPKIYLDYSTGKYIGSKCPDCIDMGYKYILDSDILLSAAGTADEYVQYNIEVSNLGENNNLQLTYADCIGKLDTAREYLFRAIDLKDPFISQDATRKTGLNWKNKYYNFVSIIKPTNGKTEYSFTLTPETLQMIKKSNDEYGANAYLGVCKTAKAKNDKVCKLVEKAKIGG